jgi:lysyl-tRNA synthetase class 2
MTMTARLAAVLFAVSLFSGNAQAAEEEAITSHIPRERVQSRGIAEVGYSKRRHLLEIEFANGAIYRYVDVPPSVYRDLISAESKARYYDANIKRNYRSMRVRPRVKNESTH